MVNSKWSRCALVLGALGSAIACSTLKPGDGAPTPDASLVDQAVPPIDASPPPNEAAPDAEAPDVADGAPPSEDAPSGSDASDGSGPDTPGPLEAFAGNLQAGIGISVSSDHVYWLEQGARAGASNYDALFRRRGLTAAPCAAGDNCGAWMPVAGTTYFGDAHTGTVSSAAVTCLSVIYNATRDTEIRCLNHASGEMLRVPGTFFAASVRLAVGADLYFSVPSRAGGPTTLKRWSTVPPLVAPVDVLSRTATEVIDLVMDGDTLFWAELSGTGAAATTTLWARVGVAGVPVQIGPSRPGGARLALDAGFLYVTHLSEATIDRHPRTAAGAGPGVQIAADQRGVGPILRRGAYLLWLNYGPPPDYTASQVVRALPDGTGQVVIDNEESLTDFTATSDTAYMVSYGKDPGYIGTVKRVRFTR